MTMLPTKYYWLVYTIAWALIVATLIKVIVDNLP